MMPFSQHQKVQETRDSRRADLFMTCASEAE